MVGQSHGKSTGRRDDRMETVGHPADGNYVGDGSSDQNKSEKDTDSHNSASHSPKEHIGEISAHRPRHRRDGPLEPSEMTLSNESKSATQADSAEPAEGHSRSSIGHHAASGVKAAVASAAAEAGGKVAAWADDVPLPDIPLDVIPDGAIDTAVEIADDTKKELAGSLDAVQEAMGSAAAMVDGAGAAAFLSTIAGAAKGTLRVVANLPVFGPLAAPAWLVVAAAADIARASAANKRSCALLIRLMADVALSLTRMDPPALAALRQEVKSVVSALDIAKGVIESYRSKRWFRAVLTSKADEKRFLEAHQEVMYQWDRVTRSMTLASGSPRTPQSGSYGPDEALAKRVVALAGLPEGSDVGAAVETVAGDPRRHEALLQDMGVPQSTVEEEVRKGTEGLQEALAEIAAKIEEVRTVGWISVTQRGRAWSI